MSSVSQFKRTEVIGRGKFGVVYKAYHKQTKQLYAIKVLNLDTEEEDILDVQQEIQFLTELKSVPNITHYYGSILNDTKLWILMDYCAGGSLRTLLKPGVMEEKYIGVIVRELLSTLSAVHKLGVIHRDLKAANVLISKEGNVQLCDFGVAAKVVTNSSKRLTMAGTPYWMAPEVIKSGETYNSKADIWSLGITVYEIATGNPPYCDKDASWAMQLISKSTPPRLEGRDYSSTLKECVALCLDENPDERPSADELFKCKLVKAYKHYPTSILKEIISRYLLWRDRNSSRDSVFINLENEQEETVDEVVQNKLPGHESFENNNEHLQVRWDFDSLESKEYIMENDIDVQNLDYNKQFDTEKELGSYSTLPTLKANTLTSGNAQTPTTKSVADVPKSLQMLFEDPEEKMNDQSILQPPSLLSSGEGTESPTIEIPDMDVLSSFPSTGTLLNVNQSVPTLTKPPTLHHTQSASGNLESRFNPMSTSPTENRTRKKTISTTLGSGTSSMLSPSTVGATPHTPPYTINSSARTPSPKPPSTTNILNATGLTSKSGSPSKMKALQGNHDPLLQPINFKYSSGDGYTDSNAGGSNPPGQAPPPLPQQHSMPILAHSVTAGSNAPPPSNIKSKRNKPGFIQMPTPSNSLNVLSALTSETTHEDENVNQFGINPAQVANMPISMTPVTEREPPQYPMKNDDNADKPASTGTRDANAPPTNITTATIRPHQNSISAQKKPQPSPSSSNVSVNGSNAHHHHHQNASVNTSKAVASTSSSANSTSTPSSSSLSFPTIPPIKSEFFIDSTTNRSKLVSELDSIIKLFNHGLDTLETNL
ncbi:KIC1 [Candida theae]|uniref:non-specific serine/threonine protein kinase n=1 Tax=Candida theae TaxID=1198502 RepID=A0AAD5BG14_9ASCO|nr:KIC1 [Candida theae]KAI5960527.1 KIC1 [Candida theae]